MKKKSKKETRAHKVLMGVIDLYLKTGKPIGSNTLKDQGFEDLSSATIRNYFAELETEGLLRQPHSSGGRIPTQEGLHLYASEVVSDLFIEPEVEERLSEIKNSETRHLTSFLHQATETLSELTGFAAFISSVRFDHDFIRDLKLVLIDNYRLLGILLTEFGQIYTEVLNIEGKLSSHTLKRIELYFQWRLKGHAAESKPHPLTEEEEALAMRFYNELMIRYIVRYSNFSNEETYRTGFSKLLAYPEFNDPVALAGGLSLFENENYMRLLLNDCVREADLKFWIGNQLSAYGVSQSACAVVAVPYRVHQTCVGAVGILGPCRMPYRSLFGTLKLLSDSLSAALTKSLYTYKLSYRQPRSGTPYMMQKEQGVINQTSQKLIEIKE